MINLLLGANFFLILIIYLDSRRLKKQIRVLNGFIAGIVDHLMKVTVGVETLGKDKVELVEYSKVIYKDILFGIRANFESDMAEASYKDWLRNDRNLFFDKNYTNLDWGFNRMYFDMREAALKELEADKRDS